MVNKKNNVISIKDYANDLKRMTDNDALTIIRDILKKDPARMIITDHAKKKMLKRKIIKGHVTNCLNKGRVIESPFFDAMKGDWKLRVKRYTAGKEISVVVALNLEEEIIIITAF